MNKKIKGIAVLIFLLVLAGLGYYVMDSGVVDEETIMALIIDVPTPTAKVDIEAEMEAVMEQAAKQEKPTPVAEPTVAPAEPTVDPTEALTSEPTEMVTPTPMITAKPTPTPTPKSSKITPDPSEAVTDEEAEVTPSPVVTRTSIHEVLHGENEKTYKFRNSRMLNEHYNKHGKDMGFESAEEYEAAAVEVIKNSNSLCKTEKEDGDYVYYLERTNEFVVVSKSGFIRTYFLPDDGREYFDRQ